MSKIWYKNIHAFLIYRNFRVGTFLLGSPYMLSQIASLIGRAYKMQTANLALYNQQPTNPQSSRHAQINDVTGVTKSEILFEY